MNEVLLVSYVGRHNKDESVMIIGKKRENGTVEILNALTGKDATDIYEKLVKVKVAPYVAYVGGNMMNDD